MPSILNGTAITDHPVIGVNDAFRLGVWVDLCWFGDARWYWWNKADLKSFTGMKVTCNRTADGSPSVAKEPGLYFVQRSNEKGICVKKNIINFNSSSGASAVNLAWHLGASQIVLVGFDMRKIGEQFNWHPHPLPKVDKPYTNLLRPFRQIALDASQLGLKIWNATPGSLLKEFPFIDFKEALCLS